MRKLKIELKQHTPLIHFQHDQEGATLRASEVKPKLDRYILTKLGEKYYDEISDDEFEEVATTFEKKEKKNFDKIGIKAQEFEVGIYVARKKKWIVSKNGNALNYKMRIQTDNGSSRSDFMLASYINNGNILRLQNHGIMPISNSPYFAQEKENRDIINSDSPVFEWNKIEKKGILEKGTIHITLLCLNKDIEKELFEFLSSIIQSFFITTNFGTRQSKGFGSFTVKELINENQQMPLAKEELLLKKNFLFVYKRNDTNFGNIQHNRIKRIFSTINDDYKLLKSGRRGIEYKRSKVMLYADEEGKKWEKRQIKRKFNAIPKNPYRLKSEHNNQPHYNEEEEYLYYRALLGLAEQFEFLLNNPPAKNSKMIVKVSPNSSEIQRYQSPLLFKVIDNNIYLVGNEVCAEMLGKTFTFQMSVQKDTKHIKDDFSIKTPSTFNLKDFISFAMEDNSDYTKLK